MHPSPSPLQWVEDPVRGRRSLEFTPPGRPRRWVLADGTQLEFEPGEVRASDGSFVRLAGDRVESRHATLTPPFDFTRPGSSDRFLPGCPTPLRYTPRPGGELSIGWADAPPLIRILPQGTVLWADGRWQSDHQPHLTRWQSGSLSLVLESDPLGRPIRRSWSDGTEEAFQRDTSGRLTHWSRLGPRPEWQTYHYSPTGITGRSSASGFEAWELDAAGRVRRAGRAEYHYDANGRRIRGPGVEYRYDAFGQLLSANHTRFDYDGLGRRIAVHRPSGSLWEHRDFEGRLWCLTDATGRARHVFLWHQDRPLARLDDGELAEIFLCDDQATLLAWADARTGLVTRVDSPPFGAVHHPLRPALHGHFGDPETGLIHFGARDYDPATASFLTPDPFHGGPDDPRAWLSPNSPLTPADPYPYALACFDPVARTDRDGHASGYAGLLWGFLNIPLSLTWGWPLTAISAFFFTPINLYFELIGRIIQFFRFLGDEAGARRAPGYSTFPWPNHSIFGSRLLAGSVRQGQLAFSLNGFLPRVVSGHGIDADRAVTIGQVIWIRRHELAVLARPSVLRAHDIEGDPTGTLKPFNQNPADFSVLAVTCTNKSGKDYVHISFWTRGPGNTVTTRGAGPAARQTFSDLPDASGKKPFHLHLARPIPLDVDTPRDKNAAEKLAIAEYTFAAGTQVTTVVLDTAVAFALRMRSGRSILSGDWLQLSFPEDLHIDPVSVLAASIDQDNEAMAEHTTVLLYKGFPPRVLAPGGPALKDLTARRLRPSTVRAALGDWDLDGTNSKLRHEAAGVPAAQWPPDLRHGDFLFLQAATAATPFVPLTSAVPPANDTAVAKLLQLSVTVKVTAALTGAPAFTNTAIRILRSGKKQPDGVVEVAAKSHEIQFPGDKPSLETGHYVVVTRIGSADRAYGRVKTFADRLLTLDWLSAPLAIPKAKTPVTVQRLNAAEDEDDQATASNPSGDTFTLVARRTRAFAKDTLLLLRDVPHEEIRVIDSIVRVQIEVSDDVVGTGKFRVQPASIDEQFSKISGIEQAPLSRFLRHTAGPLPSTYQAYPQSVISVVLNPFGHVHPVLHEFYLRSNAASLQPGYSLRWRPFTHDGTEYFLLDRDLPIYPDGPKTYWYYDRDEPLKTEITPPFTFEVREYTASGAARDDTTGPRVLAVEPETLVPEEPIVHFTHHDSLVEHEIHHTVQNARYGPFMGALPLQGMLNDVVDVVQVLRDKPRPDWLTAAMPDFDSSDQGFNYFEIASIGGIMSLTMKYVLLGPLLLHEDSRREVLKLDYDELMKVISPLWSALIRYWPRPNPDDKSPVDPHDPYSKDGWEAFAEFFLRAMDLRSWTPFIGMIPTWLGDGPRNFVEQQASRASGDLYSTILSADDHFNRDTKPFLGVFGRGSTSANLKRPLGSVIRMMIFAGGRNDRLFGSQNADETGWAFRYQQLFSRHPAATVLTNAGGLVHPELYEPTPGSPAPPTVPIEGPDGIVVPFPNLPAGATFRPRLRALVPIPPQVSRSAGFYFIATTPGTYHLTSYDSNTGDPKNDAKTAEVDLTIEDGKLTLDQEDIPWKAPTPHPNPPTQVLKRFVTETAQLRLVDQTRDRFIIKNDAPAGGPVTLTDSSDGATIAIGAPPAAGAPPPVRIRVFRQIKQADPAFDLHYGDTVPELKNVRSFLASDLWLPFRDFLLQPELLPPLADFTLRADQKHTVSLALALERREKFALRFDPPPGAPRPLPGTLPIPTLTAKRIGPSTTVSPRGEDWSVGPLDGLIEENATFKLEIEHGTPPRIASLSCKVTVEPPIRLTGTAPLLARQGAPLNLTIAGGTGPYSVDLEPEPSDVQASVSGSTVTITIGESDTPIPESDAVVTVKDASGLRGRRTIRLTRP